jgi:radical SAM superfamily enzyme YgiQ (UPF0313 family)
MRIALIAMSGIRVCDRELLWLGFTLPGFVERGKTIAALPSLGLLTLAGMTPPEHNVEYIEVRELPESGGVPEGFDLVAISSYSAQVFEAYALADRCRAAGIPVVMGGLHVSMLPDEAARHCDAVVVGEGEPVWRELLQDAGNGRLQPRYGSLRGEFDLADAPVPAFERLDISRYNRLTVQTSRGCPHHCEFCASSVLVSPRYKQKPIGRVLAEIDRILELWPQPFLEFADDNSLVDRDYWKELLRELRRRNIRWFTETDLSVSEDGELLGLMRESGCAQVLIGLESPVDTGLAKLELRNDWKHRRRSRYRDAIRTIQAHGITVNGCFILGLDGHGPGIFDQVYDFVEDSGLYEVQITIQTAFPGTPLYARLKTEGRIVEDGRWDRCTLFDVNFVPSGMTAGELVDGFRRLVVRLYGEESTLRRRRRFRHELKVQRRVAQ